MSWRGNPLLGYWRRMSEQPTAAEFSLEPAIAALSERYRHQYPFWGLKYFADFALLDRKLIIEVDGDSHDKPSQKEKDLRHTLQVLELGWRIFRCSNFAALTGPGIVVQAALAYSDSAPDKAFLIAEAKAALAQLHQDYPHLLEPAAKKSKSRKRPAPKRAAAAIRARGKRATPAPARS